jgi:D-3-phosphoglycerate dehydrogenase
VIGAEDLESLGPYIPLAAKLGRIAMELTGGRADEITVTSYGGLADYDTRLLTVSALNGAFQGRADRPVNYVNAPLIARERGIEVREERSQSARDFTNLLRVEIAVGEEVTRIAGTLIGSDNRQWLVSALGFELDLELAPLLVLATTTSWRHRPRRHTVRRRRRQHREHDGLAHPPGRQGADGAHGGLDAAGARRAHQG